ncbi:MAG: glycosyltransferase family 4 protein [Bacteroidetes bacterium]|nr:glycosyltransferase family 4 protein [Bacteroidota bacterium]
MRKKILFIASHRKDRAPGQRFRFEQYFDYLNQHGFTCELSFLLDEKSDKVFYKPGHYFSKLVIFIRSYFIRFKNLLQKNDYDIIFIFREALMTRSVYFEKQFRKSKAKLVFDFDDAIWHFDISEANKNLGWLKNPEKTEKIISISNLVIAGNNYLADYAKRHNACVHIIPTTIDTDYHKKKTIKKDNRICIGWTGSHTTIQHFEYAIPMLKKLKDKYRDKIYFKVIGDENYFNTDLSIQGIKWSLKDEIEQLSEIDIGIMPLPENEWTKGKCGFKGLQYMALEIPCVMSPIGVNSEIISDGVNGFLADKEDEWVEKISMLIENAELRKKIGTEARKTVIEKYSVESNKEKYLNIFNRLLS